MRHAFQILEQLGAECDRLGVRVVDLHGESDPASDFLAKIVYYIEARERECDRPTLTDAEREAVKAAATFADEDGWLMKEQIATLRGLLERLHHARTQKAPFSASDVI